MEPYFSIIIPLFNKEESIKNTLQSVVEQTFKNFEIIIVNDGSTDNSLKVAKSFVDESIEIFSIKNHGVSYARNYGISKSNSKYIAFLDADDKWFPNHLADLKNLIEKYPDCGLYATGYESVFYGKTEIKAKYIDLDENFSGIVKDFFHHSLVNQIAWTSAVVIPKQILERYGGFDASMKAGEDTDLWTRIALQENVAYDSKTSAQKIMTPSTNHLSKTHHVLDRMRLLNKFEAQEKTNTSFKKYMDYNRYSIAIERKMAGDLDNFKRIKKDIHLQNLNKKQQFLIALPGFLLTSLKRLQSFLLKHKIYLSAYR
ncbi:MAG: glycosyltransferase family 2 protein [Aquaticitalea sp.]